MLGKTACPIVRISALTKRFGNRAVLDQVSFTIAPGEVVALLGPNGAGKTTLIGCLLGFLLPDVGSIELFGRDVAALAPEWRARTGFVPQKMTGFSAFRVGELISYLGRFYARPSGETPAWLWDWADLDTKARVKALSGGQRQRLSILLAMRHEPDLLVLDEPVASLDPQARREFMAMLTGYCAQTGRSALISSHILSDLEKIVTRAIFMRRGTLVHDTPMLTFREATRWVTAPVAAGVLRDALPESLALLAQAPETGALLVDGWSEDAAGLMRQSLGVELEVTLPDLETAFLEMTR